MKVYALKSCDTCRRAIRALRAVYPDLEVIDVREDGIDEDTLQRFHAAFGDDLINRRSTTWRGLSEGEKTRAPVALLREHPTLMKRPVIEANGQLYLGWGANVQAALLG